MKAGTLMSRSPHPHSKGTKPLKKSRRIALVIGSILTLVGFAFQLEPLLLHKSIPVYGIGFIVFAWTFFFSMLYNEWAGGKTRRKLTKSRRPKPSGQMNTPNGSGNTADSLPSKSPNSTEQ